MNYLIYFCAAILPWILAGALVLYLVVNRRKSRAWRLVGLAFFSATLAWFLASLYKYNFPSLRPFEIYDSLKPLFTTGRGDAFPSGHATFLGALAVGVFLQKKKLGLVFIIGAILVALARFLANVHSASDVIVGLLFGGLVAVLVKLIYNRILVE